MTLHDKRVEQVDQATAITAAVAKMLHSYQGKRFLGVVDGLGCTEIVFSDDGGPNLLTLEIENNRLLRQYHGGVADPEDYVAACAVK